jgi:hypothetical protein
MAKHSGDKKHVTETPDVSYIRNPDVAHELSDVNVGAILKFVGGLLVFGVVTLWLMWLMLRFFEAREERTESQPGPMALTEQERLPPAPRLQGAPGFGVNDPNLRLSENLQLKGPQAEYRAIKKRWDEILEKGMVNPNTGEKIIPIQEAIKKLVAEQGAAARPQPDNHGSEAGDMDLPSDSSAGRMAEKKDW